jgi:hypothetical protein
VSCSHFTSLVLNFLAPFPCQDPRPSLLSASFYSVPAAATPWGPIVAHHGQGHTPWVGGGWVDTHADLGPWSLPLVDGPANLFNHHTSAEPPWISVLGLNVNWLSVISHHYLPLSMYELHVTVTKGNRERWGEIGGGKPPLQSTQGKSDTRIHLSTPRAHTHTQVHTHLPTDTMHLARSSFLTPAWLLIPAHPPSCS